MAGILNREGLDGNPRIDSRKYLIRIGSRALISQVVISVCFHIMIKIISFRILIILLLVTIMKLFACITSLLFYGLCRFVLIVANRSFKLI